LGEWWADGSIALKTIKAKIGKPAQKNFVGGKPQNPQSKKSKSIKMKRVKE